MTRPGLLYNGGTKTINLPRYGLSVELGDPVCTQS